MLEAHGLTKSYASVVAVKDVSFTLARGQVLGCLGPNGSGKSTTVKMLIGLLEPSGGKVLFNGEDIHEDLAGFRKLLGYVPEEPNLYPYLSGHEYLEMIGLLRGIPQATLGKKMNSLLHLFSLDAHRHASLASYSKGMRQRILLIAALMDDPKLLIFDEPLSGLDVTTALVLKNLIRELGQQGRAVFYCSHVLEVVEQVCSHLLILRKGEVLAYGTTEAIQHNVEHSSLEKAFVHMIEEVDTNQIARDVICAMEGQ
jgi:ABC-2 type transport system ATP-binding protein